MAIVFTCDKCGKQLKVSEDFAGKKARCPGCNATLTVPMNHNMVGAVPLKGKLNFLLISRFVIVGSVGVIILLSLITGMLYASVLSAQIRIDEIRENYKDIPTPYEFQFSDKYEYELAKKKYDTLQAEIKGKTAQFKKERDEKFRALLGSTWWKAIALTLALLSSLAGCAYLFCFGSPTEKNCGIIGIGFLLVGTALLLPSLMNTFRGGMY